MFRKPPFLLLFQWRRATKSLWFLRNDVTCCKTAFYPPHLAVRNTLYTCENTSLTAGTLDIRLTDELIAKAQAVDIGWFMLGLCVSKYGIEKIRFNYCWGRTRPREGEAALCYPGQKSAIIVRDNLTKNIAPLVHTYTLSPYTLHFVRRRKGKHSVHLQGFLRPQRADRQRSDTPLFFCVVNEKEMN